MPNQITYVDQDPAFYSSAFFRWCSGRPKPTGLEEGEKELKAEALEVFLQSVEAGEITMVDGISSPLSKRIAAHHRGAQFEMNFNWIGVPQAWECPCCGRSKFAISRLGPQGQILAKLTEHHDHMDDALQDAFNDAFQTVEVQTSQNAGRLLVERMGGGFAAFQNILICEDCNNADTKAKQLIGAPKYFSFSPSQIVRFISPRPHQSHQVQADLVRATWDEVEPSFLIRMKIIKDVARAAATNTHWYEPYASGTKAIPVFENTHLKVSVFPWINGVVLARALGVARPVAKNTSRWRTEAKPRGKPLPQHFEARLCSEGEKGKTNWEVAGPDWSCSICRRSRYEAAYVGERGKISFYTSEFSRTLWPTVKHFCNHCKSTLVSLKGEVEQEIGYKLPDSYSFVSPQELSSIINARPHSAHLVLAVEAETLVNTIVARLAAVPAGIGR